MGERPSSRVVELFARVEETAERLLVIVAEERELRGRLRELWREKTAVVATLADETRHAALTEITETLNRQRKAKR
jgi:hypothetical protein